MALYGGEAPSLAKARSPPSIWLLPRYSRGRLSYFQAQMAVKSARVFCFAKGEEDFGKFAGQPLRHLKRGNPVNDETMQDHKRGKLKTHDDG
ncbi:hypothetical protein Acr_00g0043840 [Actinidia rufa]|uniref:Uncharacterized protein n=1 Tax=Actinidia rufa TaxID=165716 RepID=A0A7J0DIP0_9ERIC|nr:hypothetical protein Acr_00g0043840 [Actinidia rufa]